MVDAFEQAKALFPFLSDLSRESQVLLAQNVQLFHKEKGVALLAQGDRIGGVYLMLAGELNVHTLSMEGREATMYTVRAGESCVFALNAMFSNLAYPAWVRVEVPGTTILYIPGALFKKLFDSEKAVRDWVLSVQSQRIFDLMSAMEEAQNHTLEERLASYLVRSVDERGKIRRTHEAIAGYLGTSREVVTRHLRCFSEQGAIRMERGCITLVDAKGLHGASG